MVQTAITPDRPTRGRPRSFDRDQALDQAMRVFWDKGFAATSMADLTKAMGINAPSLYAAFGSKEGLFREALDRYDQMAQGLNCQIMDSGAPIRDQIEQALRLSTATGEGQRPAGCMVIMACTQRSELSADLVLDLEDKRMMAVRMLTARLQRAMVDGELPADLDAPAIANFFATVQRGLAVSSKGGAEAQETERVIQTAMSVWPSLTRTSLDQL